MLTLLAAGCGSGSAGASAGGAALGADSPNTSSASVTCVVPATDVAPSVTFTLDCGHPFESDAGMAITVQIIFGPEMPGVMSPANPNGDSVCDDSQAGVECPSPTQRCWSLFGDRPLPTAPCAHGSPCEITAYAGAANGIVDIGFGIQVGGTVIASGTCE